MVSRRRFGKRTCILLVVTLLVLCLIPAVFAQAQASSDAPFRFVVLPDMHINCSQSAITDIHKAAIEAINELKPSFVISVGNLVDIRSSKASQNPKCIETMWSKVDAEIIAPLQGQSLFFFTPGRQDASWTDQVGSHDVPFGQDAVQIYDDFWSQFQNRNYAISGEYGSYYSFDFGNAHFIALYASGSPGLLDAKSQMEWLKSDLAEAGGKFKHIFTFANSPLFSKGFMTDKISEGPKAMLSQNSDLMGLLKGNGVKAHFAGYSHMYSDDAVQGIPDVISGFLGGYTPTTSGGELVGMGFVVVDVDGDYFSYDYVTAPDFDISDFPYPPEVASPLPTPEVPDSLAGLGVCPPGTRLVSSANGGISPMSAPAGVSSATPPSVVDGSVVLETARSYEGRSYGTGSGEFVCTTFVEQVLKDLGISISSDMHKQIQISGYGKSPAELIAENNPGIKGVSLAITAAGLGEAISVADAKPGDFVQYWYQSEDGVWKGHSAIIARVAGDGKFDIYGAHAGKSTVTTLNNVMLDDPEKQVFMARLDYASISSSAQSAAQSAIATQSSSAAVPAASTTTTTPAVTSSISGCGTNIAAIGDSITAKNSYVVELRKLCGAGTTIKNSDDDPATNQEIYSARKDKGIGCDYFACIGKRTSEMVSSFDKALSAGTFDTVIVLGGINNIGQGTDKIKSDLETMYKSAKAKGLRVVGVTILPAGGSNGWNSAKQKTLDEVNAWIMSGAPVDIRVNAYYALEDPDNPGAILKDAVAKDMIHPTAKGKEMLAKAIHDALSGAAPTEVSPAAAGASTGVSGLGSGYYCIPDSFLPATIYDFVLRPEAGITTIFGIARQNLAVGIKEDVGLMEEIQCTKFSADRDYNLDYLKQTYGTSRLEIEAQLQTVEFMRKEIRVHKRIAPVFQCIEKEILECEEGKSYDFRTIDSFDWQAPAADPDLLATSAFGIALNINMDTNPASQGGDVVTDMPQCVIDAFRNYGFRWGGDLLDAKVPSLFEFMTDPSRIRIQKNILCPPGTELVTISSGSAEAASTTPEQPVSSGATSLIGNSDFVWPIPDSLNNWNNVRSCYGPRTLSGTGAGYHDGIDITLAKGADILSITEGTVVKVCKVPDACRTCNAFHASNFKKGKGTTGTCTESTAKTCGARPCGGFGNNVVIKHGDNLYSHYVHLDTIASGIEKDIEVAKGQKIGTLGNTGYSRGGHLHFAIYNDWPKRKTGDPEYPEAGRNPFCYFPDSILTQIHAKGTNCKIVLGEEGKVLSSTHPNLLKDCEKADLSMLASLTPTPAAQVPATSTTTGTQLVQACRPIDGAMSAPGSESPVAEEDACRYCKDAKRILQQFDPDAYSRCTGDCCSGACPPGLVIKDGIELISQCDANDMGEGSDCWHDGVAPERTPAQAAKGDAESYCKSACGVAVAKMALDAFGIAISSQELFCGGPNTVYLPGGTRADLIETVAQKLGLPGSDAKSGIDWADITSKIISGKTVALLVSDKGKTLSERAFDSGGHYILLYGASNDYVVANDPGRNSPEKAERIILSKDYLEESGRRYVVIG